MSRPQPFDYLVARTAADPEGVLVDSLDVTLRNSEALNLSRTVAGFMRNAGIQPGDVVALNLPTALHAVFTLAAFHEAAISCAFGPWLMNSSSIRPDWLFSTSDYPAEAAGVVFKVDETFFGRLLDSSGIEPRVYPGYDSYCRLVHSSGTTGTPKAVPLSLSMMDERAHLRAEVYGEFDCAFITLDVSSVGGIVYFYMALRGNEAYLTPGPASHNLGQILKHGVDMLMASPAHIDDLLPFLADLAPEERTLREIRVVGSHMPTPLANRTRDVTGAAIYNSYGASEAAVLSRRTVDNGNPFDIGFLVDGAEAQIVDEHDRPLPVGETGRLRYRQTGQAVEYFRDPTASAAAFRDGWFYPGDLATQAPDGHFELAGRTAELLNIGGGKIDPNRIDEFLRQLSLIDDAAAFSFREGDGDRLGVALVASAELRDEDVQDQLRRTFGPVARASINRVSHIPRTNTGKPLRRELASQLESELKNRPRRA